MFETCHIRSLQLVISRWQDDFDPRSACRATKRKPARDKTSPTLGGTEDATSTESREDGTCRSLYTHLVFLLMPFESPTRIAGKTSLSDNYQEVENFPQARLVRCDLDPTLRARGRTEDATSTVRPDVDPVQVLPRTPLVQMDGVVLPSFQFYQHEYINSVECNWQGACLFLSRSDKMIERPTLPFTIINLSLRTQ